MNAYGWRRVRSRVTSPRLLSTPTDRYFALRNQLHPVWQKNQYVEEVVSKRGNAPRALMQVMDNLKSMGFDHTIHTNFDLFAQQIDALESQGLKWRVDEQYELLVSINVLMSIMLRPNRSEVRAGDSSTTASLSSGEPPQNAFSKSQLLHSKTRSIGAISTWPKQMPVSLPPFSPALHDSITSLSTSSKTSTRLI